MPGDYLFPKRLFKGSEPLDTVELNDALQTSVERLNGHLGPHNIRAPLAASLTADAGTFFRTKVATVDVDSQMESATPGADGQSPLPDVPNSFLLEQQTSWQMVEGGDVDMLVDMSTGSSMLSITASASHCFAGNATSRFAKYFVDVPLFRDNLPDTQELSNNGRRNPALINVAVTLESTTYTISNLRVVDIRQDGSFVDQSRELASRIVAALPSDSSDGIADDGWVSTTGYAVKAEGRRLFFRRQSSGSPPGGSTFQIVFSYKNSIDLSRTQVTTRTMTEVSSGAVSGTPVAQKFSALESCKPFPTEPEVVVYFPAQIQYALRVDGVILTETITGRFDNERAPITPARIVDPRDNDSPVASAGISGPGLGAFRERPDAINIPMFSVRLSASIKVEPGDHVVELVVRRVPTGRRRSFTPPPPEVGNPVSSAQYLPPQNRVYIYSRQLVVTDIPDEPIEAAEFGTPAVVSSFKDEDVVSKKTLVDDRLQRVAEETNDIQSFQVARGAINGDHLERFSSVIASGATSLSNVSVTLNSSINRYRYPDVGTPIAFGNGRFFHPMAGLQWKQILEVPLELTASLSSPLDCVLTVEGNVFLERLVHSGAPIQDEMHLAATCFLIAVREQNSGLIYAWRPSISWVNSNNYIAYQRTKDTTVAGNTDLFPASGPTPTDTVGLNYLSRYGEHGDSTVTSGDVPGDFVDVPVTAYVDFTGVVAGTVTRALILPIDRVYLYGAAAFMGTAGRDAQARIKHASLNAVAMKS